MRAVFKKEFIGSFKTSIGWSFLAVAAFFLGWYFRYYGLGEGLPYVSYIINAALFIFLFSFPILTMRSFSEEKRMRTDQLLFTVPVPLWRIVAGKYLAAVCVFLPVVPLLLLFSLLLRIFGQVPFTENMLAVLCFACFGMACIAIGIYISALSDSQITAAILTFFVLLLGTLMPQILAMASVNGNTLTRFFSFLSLTQPFDYSLYGVLYLPSYLYYASIILVMLTLTVFHLRLHHLRLATRGALDVVAGLIALVTILVVIVLANYIVALMPETEKSIDLTYNKIRSMTDAGRLVLDTLSEDVDIYVLAEEREADETVDATLRYMADYSDYIHVSYISPAQNPYFYLSYTDVEPVRNSLIVVSQERSRLVDYFDCYRMTYDYSYNMATGNYEASDYHVTGYDGEGRILAAVSYVANGRMPRIACIAGHDELELPESLLDRIETARYEVVTLQLIDYEEIPEDIDILFILGPFADFNREDADKVRRFFDRGGCGILVCAFTDAAEPTEYYALLADYGIEVLPGVIAEGDPSYYNTQAEYLLPEILSTELTQSVYTELRTKYVYLPFSKALRLTEQPEVSAETFLRTTEEARAGAARGPFSVAVYVQRYLPDGKNRIVVFGSDYFLYDEINRAVNGANYDLFLRTLKIVSETDELAEIPVKSYSYDPLMVGRAAKSLLSVLLVGLIPLGLVAAGGYVWYNRYHQA